MTAGKLFSLKIYWWLWFGVSLCQAQEANTSPHGPIQTPCATCHVSTDWRQISNQFDHSQTGFPLEAAHAQQDCRSCHQNLVFAEAPDNCVDCHLDIHRGELGVDCATCHVETGWDIRLLMLENHKQTLFPLLGPHARLECEACHVEQQRNEYHGTSIDCLGCHLQDYEASQDPDHQAVGFSTDCEICHQPVDARWENAVFEHPPTFPLTGGHFALDCRACHEDGFANTPTDCIACHEADFMGVEDPNHITNNFPTDCEQCHTTSAWEPSTFDHMQTAFPLTGGHLALDCRACHEDGFANTPTDCIACHEPDYNNAAPNHAAAGFPTDCTLCHNTNAWEPSSFNHDGLYFPIYSGEHRGEWDTCNDCHLAGNFNSFECITCHEHNQADMAEEHEDVSGYVYDSPACLSCHPDGRK